MFVREMDEIDVLLNRQTCQSVFTPNYYDYKDINKEYTHDM